MMTKIKVLIVIVALVITTWFIYKPGFTGGFMFDDESNLNSLSIIADDLSLTRLQTYFGESKSGPLKRPISVFSFLIDAQNWPAGAYSFKRTNVILHVFNGFLLFTVLWVLFRQKGFKENKVLFIAGFATGFWLFHPFLVSTTLYVVQRMAMLPLTFMLVGIWFYLLGRKKYQIHEGTKGHVLLFSAVYVMTLLAMLSKENGIVFLWLIFLFEVFIIQWYLDYKSLNRHLSFWLLKLPAIAAIVLFLMQVPAFIADYDVRQFNMGQRLITETRAVGKYLFHWFIPDYFTEGVFTDGFKFSKNIFNPLTTVFSTVFVIALLSLAWIKRKQWVWFSFVVFFFFVAQILESTIVPLELYFEHRVYVGAIFIGVPISLGLYQAGQQSKIFLIIPVLICFILAGMTYMRSDIWGNNLQLHELTMEKFPESLRARMGTAGIYDSKGLVNEASQLVKDGFKYHDKLELTFNTLGINCVQGTLTLQQMDNAYNKIKKINLVKNDYWSFLNLIKLMFDHNCLSDNTYDAIFELADAFEQNPNPKIYQKQATAKFIKGQVYFKQGKYESSKDMYIESFEISQNDYEAMNTAIIQFINKDQYDYALEILDFAESLYFKDFKYKIDWLKLGDNFKGLKDLIKHKKNETKD
ncbi:hypothetical protein GCM10011365_24840 [Marinicella pacifica]|uniref:Tetratricopeptide repeat protein n=1 Tax=Marinicella pacifica TaxID=1171543 RepID=A0A917CZA0_9GAMM|nr:tetratricopeptide repeat protein [Marinicella pacifica]GGG02690.1 hypothetical protein GCM10011365_24840 [Marinicella pacifica]